MVLDITRSLQFHHTVCEPLVIHSDIKPSNILLDAYLSAKITDFGLARLKTPIADDLQAVVVSPASNLDDDNKVAIEIVPNKAMTGDSKSFSNVKESAVGGGEDEASIMGETTESTMMATRKLLTTAPTLRSSSGSGSRTIVRIAPASRTRSSVMKSGTIIFAITRRLRSLVTDADTTLKIKNKF
ncbi:hypothetical protein COCNU_scaffold004123G000010 [Cocos nucifera]|nr:hypothetical protein [Cocos nucifera]